MKREQSDWRIVCIIMAAVLILMTACRNESDAKNQANAADKPAAAPVNANENKNDATGNANSTGNTNSTSSADPTSNANSNRASEAGDTAPQVFDGTVGITEKKKGDIAPVVLREVRTARQEGFDRVVFEFAGNAAPGYHIEYVDRPVRQCGSGKVVRVTGDAWLRVQLMPAQAHTDAGEATVKDRERRPNITVLKEMKAICDFEAEVTWVLGLSRPNRYRVLELTNPTRLVIDVKH